ncbi:Fic family protein [Bogoriella caseilytica]|uniref:Fic family protein n=1 Tax=Bogoriella caseilytica TaxID=56055 RepID=A0A3N2BCY3_9MICO|nr:Fic family protein [Bogoriella caseilytica]
MSWTPDAPYEALPPLPPAAELETRAVLKAAIDARDALARFDARASALPNPTILINAIPLLEAQASSEIENIVTTTDELFSAALSDVHASAATREALRYRSALRAGFGELGQRPLTAQSAVRLCSIIRGHETPIRDREVIIGDPSSRRRVYTPPASPTVIDDLLRNWTRFINGESSLDPLVRMAVAHYQFEAIHPFTDGNGRTGRILNVLMLCAAGLLQLPLLYLSRYIIETKDAYYRRLLDVTASAAWEDWILYMLEGVRQTSIRTGRLVERIGEVQVGIGGVMREALGSVNADLLAVVMEQPYARTRDVMERCGVSRPTATKWLRALVRAGALETVPVGREVLYINVALMETLRT